MHGVRDIHVGGVVLPEIGGVMDIDVGRIVYRVRDIDVGCVILPEIGRVVDIDISGVMHGIWHVNISGVILPKVGGVMDINVGGVMNRNIYVHISRIMHIDVRGVMDINIRGVVDINVGCVVSGEEGGKRNVIGDSEGVRVVGDTVVPAEEREPLLGDGGKGDLAIARVASATQHRTHCWFVAHGRDIHQILNEIGSECHVAGHGDGARVFGAAVAPMGEEIAGVGGGSQGGGCVWVIGAGTAHCAAIFWIDFCKEGVINWCWVTVNIEFIRKIGGKGIDFVYYSPIFITHVEGTFVG